MSIPTRVDLTTIIGRVVSAFRQEMNISQAVFADRLKWDRSLLARIESGRNTANIDNIYELEKQFLESDLIGRHGDLVELTNLVAREAIRRGFRVWVGNLPKPEGEDPVELRSLDRLVAVVIDTWLDDRSTNKRSRTGRFV